MRDKLRAAAVIKESTFLQFCKLLCSYSLVHLVQFVSNIVVRKLSVLWDGLALSVFRRRRMTANMAPQLNSSKAFHFLVQKRGAMCLE
jgi:hypothetical protein